MERVEGAGGRKGEPREGGMSCYNLSIFSWKKFTRACAQREVEAGEREDLRSESKVARRQLGWRGWNSVKLEK